MKKYEKTMDIAYWDGEKDSSWYEPMNWFSNTLPSNSAIVHINDNRPYLPVLDTFAACRKLIIGEYSTLTISPIGSLTVDSLLINKGNLILQADSNSRATLISPVENQQLGQQKYMFQADSNINHILANPMNQSVWKASEIVHIQEYLVDEQKWDSTIMFPIINDLSQPYWYSSSDSNLSFIGAINFENVVYQNDLQAEHFLAMTNPYTSYLHLDQTNISLPENRAIYQYHPQTNEFSVFIDGIGSASNNIEPLGSFWMLFESDEQIEFTAANGQHYFEIDEETPSERDVLALKLISKEREDKTFISFNENASADYDKAFDALKFQLSNAKQAQIFTKSSSRKLAINQLPDTSMMDMFVSAEEDGNYTISIDKKKGFDFVVLEDLIWNKRIDLLEQDYSFDYFVSDGDYPFKLYFKDWALEPVSEEDIQIYYYPESIVVRSRKQIELAEITFYDLAGRIALDLVARDFHYFEEPVRLPVGHYIVQVRTGELVVNKKVLVRK
jgi:hypothetical protein